MADGAKLLCNTRGRFITVGLGNHHRGKDKMTGKYGYYADDDDDDAILNYKPLKPPGVAVTAFSPDPSILFYFGKRLSSCSEWRPEICLAVQPPNGMLLS